MQKILQSLILNLTIRIEHLYEKISILRKNQSITGVV